MTHQEKLKTEIMSTTIQQSKFKFLTNWILLSLGIIPFSYIISLIAIGLVHGAFGFNFQECGICVLMTFFASLVLGSEISIFAFVKAAFLYGAITGATLMWILK